MSEEGAQSYVQYSNILATADGRMIIEERTKFIRKHRYDYKAGEFVDRRKAREVSLESELVAKSKGAGEKLHQAAMALSTALKEAGPEAAKIAELACAFAQNLWIFELLPSPPTGDPTGSERDEQLVRGMQLALARYWGKNKNRKRYPTHGEVSQLWPQAVQGWPQKRHGKPPTEKEYNSVRIASPCHSRPTKGGEKREKQTPDLYLISGDIRAQFKSLNKDLRENFCLTIVASSNDGILSAWEDVKDVPLDVARLRQIRAGFQRATDRFERLPTFAELINCWNAEEHGHPPSSDEYEVERFRTADLTYVAPPSDQSLSERERSQIWSEMKRRSGWSGWAVANKGKIPPR